MGFRKHINLLGYAISSIFTYRIRTVAIVSSLTVAIMVLGSVVFVSDGLEREAELSATFAPDITVQYLQAGRQILIPMSCARTIAAQSVGVKAVPRVWGYVYHQNRIYTLMGIDPEGMLIPEEIRFAILSGRFLQQNDKEAAVIGYFFAQKFGVKVDDILTLYDQSMKPHNFSIVGIFSTEVRLYTADLIIIPIQDAREFFEISQDYATDLCVYVDDAGQTRYVAQRIIEEIPNARVLTREILKEALVTAYGARSGFISIIWYIILIAVVLVAWNHASALSAETKREVGILKALGFSTSDILEVRLMEALVLGLLSASLGVFLGLIYDVYLGAPIIRDFMLGWAMVYPEFPLPVYTGFSTIVTLYAIAVFPLLVGCVFPAWNSAITEPDAAMRGV